jgi:hypothetical protein
MFSNAVASNDCMSRSAPDSRLKTGVEPFMSCYNAYGLGQCL